MTCSQQLSIAITLLIQVEKYMQGSTTLDNLIVMQDLGNALQHLSLASFNCIGAFKTSANFLEDFIQETDDKSGVYWQVFYNIMDYGNYIYREYSQMKGSDSEEQGYHLGKIITYLFRIS